MTNQTNQMKTKHAYKIDVPEPVMDIERQIAAFRLILEGKSSQVQHWYEGRWNNAVEYHNVRVNEHYRPKPQRKFVPWTFETCPVGAVVKAKNFEFRGVIKHCGSDHVSVGAEDSLSYQWVFDRYEQLNGQPCGTEVEE